MLLIKQKKITNTITSSTTLKTTAKEKRKKKKQTKYIKGSVGFGLSWKAESS